MNRITIAPGLYRGHQIGRILGIHDLWKGCWRHALDRDWIFGHVLCEEPAEAIELAKDCVDFRHRESLMALRLGRQLTMDDLIEYKALLCGAL